MLNTYEQSSTMFTPDNVRKFKELFASDDMEIFNDLMGLSPKPKLSVTDYCETFLQKNVMARRVFIKDVKKGFVSDGDSVWIMDVTFDKNVSYFYQKVYLDAEEFYGSPYHIKLQFSYSKNEVNDRNERVCKIISLEGSVDDQTPTFPSDFMVIEKNVEKNKNREETVTYQGGNLKFNKYNQMILPRGEKLSYHDADVKIRLNQDTTSNRIYKISFHPRHFRFKPHAEFSLFSNYALKGKPISYLDKKSKDFSIGFDLGYVFPTKRIMRVGIFSGVALSFSDMSLGIDSLDYNYFAPSSLDADGDNYIRHYEVRNMKQDIKIRTVMVPLYLDFDFTLSPKASAYFDVGAKVYSNLSNEVTTSVDVYKYGVYPKYQNLRIDGTWLNKFGSEHLGQGSQQHKHVEIVKSVDAFLAAGYRLQLYRQLFFDLGLQYQITVLKTPIDMPFEEVYLAPNGSGTHLPLIGYSKSGKEVVYQIGSHFDGIKRNAFKLNVGFFIKF